MRLLRLLHIADRETVRRTGRPIGAVRWQPWSAGLCSKRSSISFG